MLLCKCGRKFITEGYFKRHGTMTHPNGSYHILCRLCKKLRPKRFFYPERKLGGVDNRCIFCSEKRTKEGRRSEWYKLYLDSSREGRNLRWEANRKLHLRKYRARLLYRNALRRGDLTRPISCGNCGKSNGVIHGHHENYNKPLEVNWLCISCHFKQHRKRKFDPEKVVEG